jgi:O-antigen chain-terminating methyltransferase
MKEPQKPDITADELLQRIRDDVRQRRESLDPSFSQPPSSDAVLPGIPLQLPRLKHTDPGPGRGQALHLKDLLCCHDRQFLSLAYDALLHRRPDESGNRHFLEGLRTGRYSRTEIIGRLRFSPEGRVHKTRVKGLMPALALALAGKVPVLGYVVKWVVSLARLPALAGEIDRTAARTARQHQSVVREMNHWASRLEAAADDTVSRRAMTRLWSEMTARMDQMAEDITGADVDAVLYIKRMVLDQQRRLGVLLDEVRKHLPEPLSTDQLKVLVSEEDHLLDAMYASFEDRFRGTRMDIKSRQQAYLPVIEKAGAGTETAPVVDLGCGRGEWLELLKENGKTAVGVDINRVFIAQCREMELPIVEQDLRQYLRDQAPDSVGAVTAFQLIEHLPLKTLIQVMDDTLRVLKPGGVVIFETPNPENLMVGACHFYTDPTHHNPLPPLTARHLLEARGFADCEILRRHPCDDSLRAKDIVAESPAALVNLLYGEQDYAVIGYKADL